MRVLISPAALQELDVIASWISRDDPSRARSFVAELRAKCKALATQHAMFALVPELEKLGIRRRLHGRYSIFYEVSEEAIVVLHVIHGARDYMRLLFEDQPDD